MKFDPETLAAKPATFGSDSISELVWFLIHHKLLPLHVWGVKPGSGFEHSIQYGALRADLISNYRDIISLGRLLVQHVEQIEKELDVKFDTVLCASYSGISGATGILNVLSQQDRYLNFSIERRFKLEDISTHPFKRATHLGDIVGNVLIYDEQVNSGDTVRRLARLAEQEGARPVAALTIADRVCPFLPHGQHTRKFLQPDIPLYCMINHEELNQWCIDNPEAYEQFKNPDWNKIDHRAAAMEKLKSDTQWV